MKALAEYLKGYVESGNLIGFCPWEDGDGMVWGRILNVNLKGFRIQKICPLGQEEEIEDYSFSEILYFNEDERYAKRLSLLAGFKPTLEEKYDVVSDEVEVRRILEIAQKSGEVLRVDIPGEENISATISSLDGEWVEYLIYGDAMIASGTTWMKIEFIKGISWRNARTEAENYLLNLND